MPEQEREDEPDAEAHEPRDEQESCAADVGEVPEHLHPFGQLSLGLASEHLALQSKNA
jgi:hypothetical protein